jgi:hypothetical protein
MVVASNLCMLTNKVFNQIDPSDVNERAYLESVILTMKNVIQARRWRISSVGRDFRRRTKDCCAIGWRSRGDAQLLSGY